MNKVKFPVGRCISLAVFMLFSNGASARSTPAFQGHASFDFSSDACFSFSGGSVLNGHCGSTQTWCSSLPVDVAGTKPLSISVANPATSGVFLSCFAESHNAEGGFVSSTGTVNFFPTTLGTQTLPMGSVSVPANGYMYACCSLPPTTHVRFTSITWTP